MRPHPTKKGQPQLVLLDHGLYRQLDDGFRRDYCRLWQALVLGDRDGIEKFCRRLGAGSAYALLAGMLTLKPWDDISSSDLNRCLLNAACMSSILPDCCFRGPG